MGKLKNKKLRARHNQKARQVVDTEIDRSEENKIHVDIEGLKQEDYDDDNILVLPSQRRKTKVKAQEETTVNKLSKKQRKKLEKIVESRNKKSRRAELLESLQKVQVSKEEQALLTSTTDVYSGKSHKRKLEIEKTAEGTVKVNTISGSNKKKRKKEEDEEEEEDAESDSSVDTSDIDTDSEMEEEEEEAQENVETETAEKEISTKLTQEESKKNVPKKENIPRKPVVNIPLQRTMQIQEARLQLPILAEEQIVMEAINENPVTIICGETGSGKTTQVPQFLYEAGYAHGGGIIGVTEPRRVAAISMSKRIAYEMALSNGEVSYQIRYEGNITPNTKIKFMTDGVLLKEVQNDFLLTKYSVIIIDEAHERSVYTDILIGLLSRIVPLRHKKGNPLKLVIMSATLRVEDFTENSRLFKIPPPVIKVESRQFPVTIHFNKRTPQSDYLGEAFKKVSKIHRQLPEGGILVFVTGQQEVHSLCAKLKRAFPPKSHSSKVSQESESDVDENKEDDIEKKLIAPKINLNDYSVLPLDEEAEIQGDGGEDVDGHNSDDLEDGEDEDEAEDYVKPTGNEEPLYVLPLYSLLSAHKQAKVFDPPPEGTRLCVIATNVAETSLTIPNIKYVVDTGKVKNKFHDKVTGVSAFKVAWTSQASGNQRAGRAGRTGAGHCYRLYSSAVYSDFEKFSLPEIAQRPVDDLVLQMKDIGIDKVINFPFPTPPDQEALKAAERLLVSLGALEKPPAPTKFADTKKDPSSKITSVGRAMACFPVSPRYGKMLAVGHQGDLLPYVVAIVSALSVQELFEEIQPPASNDQEKDALKTQKLKMVQTRRTWAGNGQSLLLGDLMVLLKAVGACEYAGCSPQFCQQHGLRYKAMLEVRKLRAQLTNTVNSVIPGTNLVLDPNMAPPSDLQAKLLRQIVLAGLGDHVARRMADPLPGAEDAKKMKNAYQSIMLEEPVFIHPGSVMYKQKAEYVVYQQIDETSKLYMKGVSVVEPEWLPLFVPSHCRFSAPIEKPVPRYDTESGTVLCHRTSTFGPHFWTIPAVEVEYPPGLDRYRWFARFLLEGTIHKKLKKFATVLLSTPATMVKSWAKLQPRTEMFLKALVKEGVDNNTALLKAWDNNDKYLLSAYLEWIPQSQHLTVTQKWPPT